MRGDEAPRWGIAGLLGAGMAIGVGELLAGVFSGVPSPLAAIGGAVVDGSPPWLEDFAIATFGTADKTALAVGITVLSCVIGWFAGTAGRRRPQVVPIVFLVFGALGIAIAGTEPGTSLASVTVATVLSVSAGLLTFRWLMPRPASGDPTDGLAADRSRRRFLGMAAAAGVWAVTAGVIGRRLVTRTPDLPPITIAPPTESAPVPGPEHDFGLEGLTPIVVPNEDFYRIDTALVVPRVDPSTWSLRVTGLVDNPLSFTYDDLLGMELVEDHVTIACVSNEVGGDLVGNARWTGVSLAGVLERAGLQPGATQLVGRSVDRFTVGFPPELVFDGRGALIALAMNGDPLPAAHGFPARLIVPGLYGYVSATKWLSEIELTTWDGFDAYWVPRGWAKEAPIKTQSRIDVPRSGRTVAVGPVDVAGVAWAPLKGVAAVEVSVDGGGWIPCTLTEPLSSRAWVQWRASVDLTAGEHTVSVRAMDGTSYTQTADRVPPRPDGATGHHTIRITAA